MRQPSLRPLFAAALTCSMSACGTFCNNFWWIQEEDGGRIYGGVRADYGLARDAILETPGMQGASDRNRMLAFAVLDMPLSVVGDTLSLPLTVPRSLVSRLPRWSILHTGDNDVP